MKTYNQTYEKVFTSDRSLKKCDIDKVNISFHSDSNRDTDIYQVELRHEIKKLQNETFNQLVKIEWLLRRFRYDNMEKGYGNGHCVNSAFAIFMRNYVGFDNKFLVNRVYRIIIGYFDDFFTNFNIGNPFTEIFEYPYQHINFEHLVLVYKIPERMELLKTGEERGMRYVDFLDYVINYIMSYNEEHGDKYTLVDQYNARYVNIINKK